MPSQHQHTWETYTAAWASADAAERRVLMAKSLDPHCAYRDPLGHRQGWDELSAYMQDFQRQMPGGHFVIKQFLSHHQRSIAHWDMRNGAGQTVGEGSSFGEYGDDGRLLSMTGFFTVP